MCVCMYMCVVTSCVYVLALCVHCVCRAEINATIREYSIVLVASFEKILIL